PVRDLRDRLPLRRLARATADGAAQPPRLAGVPPGRARELRAPRRPRRDEPRRADVHPPAIAGALARAPARLLGVRPGGGGHVSARVRLAPLRVRRPGRRALPRVRRALRHDRVRRARRVRLARVPRARRRFGAGDRRRPDLPRAARARSRRARGRALDRLPRARGTVRGVGDRPDADRVDALDGRPVLHVPDDRPRAHGHPRAHVHPVRKAVPRLPATGEHRRPLLQGSRRGGCSADVRRVRRAVRVRAPDPGPERGAAAGRLRLLARRRQALPGRLSAVPPAARDAGAERARPGIRLMAKLPVDEADLVARYGPHLNRQPPGGWNADVEVEREVKTHCCFCGQQCGIILKVAGERVVGFEPWYDFPFNEGKLCPKGVKRYLQGSHPDRLLDPLERDPTQPAGFRPIGWDAALDRVVGEIRRIQERYGKDAFAMLSGVSLTNEKSYLIGKFARLALGTANLDYNGRLCMVSAGAANKKALGIDRASNPWSDIRLADVVFLAGANVAECAPITTSYVWQARDRGAKVIVADPRVTPIARTADVFLGLRPGTDSALMGAILHVLIARGWLDRGFIAA